MNPNWHLAIYQYGQLRFGRSLLLGCLVLALNGCRSQEPQGDSDLREVNPVYSFVLLSETEEHSNDGLDNLLKVTDTIFSGGEPKSDQSFQRIAELGCKTIISVDGAKPDVKGAEKWGLEYIHIPIGYDGLDREAQLSIVHAIRSGKAPFYFHCHHGKHRGPAAAAIGLVVETNCDPRWATQLLETAGTSPDYPGLWRDVANFQLPDINTQLPPLVSVADVDTLVKSMAILDRAFDNLKLCRANSWQTPVDHPDLVPLGLAVVIRESFTESVRLAREDWSTEFVNGLEAGELQAHQLESGIRDQDWDRAEQAFQSLNRGCIACHKKYRN